MRKRSLPFAVLALASVMGLRAQDPEYFTEKPADPYAPTGTFDVWQDRVRDLGPGKPDIDRVRSRLRLRWKLGTDNDPFTLTAGSVSYLGSDGNKNNLARLDNERSNGSILDIADARLRALRPSAGIELHGGLIENPLLSQESFWDGDLRIIGGGGKAFLRSADGSVEEFGVRGASGKVRLLDGGRVDIKAGEFVVKFAMDAVTWTAHLGRWDLEARQEDAAYFGRQNPTAAVLDPYTATYGVAYLNPLFRFETLGLGFKTAGEIPFEVKALRHDNIDTHERGEELQIWAGSSTRPYWPQFGYVRQLLAPTGALASLSGDDWWFHANADGIRYVFRLPLPMRSSFTASYVEQTRRAPGAQPIHRWILGFSQQF